MPNSQYQVARPMRRMCALVYDGMLILALLFLVGATLAVVGTLLFFQVGHSASDAQKLPAWYQNLVMTPAFVATLLGFYGVFWRRSGQTLGMQTWRILTIGKDGQLLSWVQASMRVMAAMALPLLCALMASVWAGRVGVLLSAGVGFLLNYAFAWIQPKGLALHDVLSKTMTIVIPKHAHPSLMASLRQKLR